jgi:riboflavin-specific deaminase-like protein
MRDGYKIYAMIESSNNRQDGKGADWAWRVILAARRLSKGKVPAASTEVFAPDSEGVLRQVAAATGRGSLAWSPKEGWKPCSDVSPTERDLLDLYLPLCGFNPGESLAVGHLGQSLDGCIATESGDAYYVTGPENILHLHRMRALCDCVMVGAETIAADNPRLTTRLVPGDNAVRVVLDPRERLHADYEVFRDKAAPTLLVCGCDRARERGACHGQAEVITVRRNGEFLDLAELLRRLRERGLFLSFVEGGGKTVSAFLNAGLLDRLQIAVAPVVIGHGRPGLQMTASATMRDCLRPGYRIFRMGTDILFDCEPRTTTLRSEKSAAPTGITRIL